MIKNLLLVILSISLALTSFAGPATTSKYIMIDQFGYRCASSKVAVIVDPQVGYNASDVFSPSTAANQYEVRKWDDDQVVLTGTLTVWNAGATHVQSGDNGWWFDFSALQTPGSYYIYDKGKNVGSYKFDIGDAVYNDVLKHTIRSYYYQRVGFAKTATYAGSKWTDAASHTKDATAVDLSGNNPKDLSGGWYDAGDYNKYTTFTSGVVPILLEAYRKNPTLFKDDYNIPESGNGVPDILDEVKWEMDWLKRMQDATGNGGLYLKVGAINFNETTPPSTDNRTRYYYGECTSATITGAMDFAIGALVYKNIPTYATYGTDLQTRAISAWNRFKASTSNFTSFQTACDDGTIKSGDADRSIAEQKEDAWTAAVYLYELTGDAEYKTYIESNYTTLSPYSNTYWNAYRGQLTTALGRVTELAGINATVKANILANLTTDYASGDFYLGAWNANKDLYRAPMPDFAYRWGSNCVKGTAGMISMMKSNLLSSNKQSHRDIAEGFVHYIHGVNPQGIVYISNMNAYGAEYSVNEFYHTWYSDGSIWDNAQTSTNGPAPGYVPGGPNYWYVQESGGFSDISPPAGMPHQKAYKEFNTGWDGTRNVASYAITENGIYYQAAFIHLLSSVMENQVCGLTKQDQTITFGTLPSKQFGDAPFTLSATASSGLAVTYTSGNTAVATVSGNTITIVGAGTAVITASQTGNTNYNAATNVTQTLTVGKANQTITSGTLPSKQFGDAPFTLSATASSGLAVTYTSGNTAVATVSGNTITIVGAGTAVITASQTGNTNYNAATNVTQTLTVGKANQTITFGTLPSKQFGDTPFTLSATASSGLAVTYTSGNTAVATVSGNTITIVGAGTAVITASQTGNTNYNAATNVTQTLTVTIVSTNTKTQLAVDAIDVYPNPTKAYTNIEFHGAFDEVKISIYAMDGKLVLTSQYGSVDTVSKHIELGSIPAGVYLVEIDTKQGLLTKRLIKE